MKQYYAFIHPNFRLDTGAIIDFQFYVITKDKFQKLIDNVVKLYQSISSKDTSQIAVKDVIESFSLFNLTSKELLSEYFKEGK